MHDGCCCGIIFVGEPKPSVVLNPAHDNKSSQYLPRRQFVPTTVSPLLYIQDALSHRFFLVDTGATLSVFPHHSTVPSSGPRLIAANGNTILSWGTRLIPLQFDDRRFECTSKLAAERRPPNAQFSTSILSVLSAFSSTPLAAWFLTLAVFGLRTVQSPQLRGTVHRSSNPWASPLHTVRKSDGFWCPCRDYRRYNVTLPDRYPVPHNALWTG